MSVRRPLVVFVLAVALWCAGRPPAAARQELTPLPASLSNAEFWKLSVELSEPGGYFRSENLVSNEHTYQYVIPELAVAARPGGVYMGVAPDQNFTYIVATRPRMAFIVDVRRGNLLQHLMYKAVFELSADRAEFVSRLFSKPRPPGLGASMSVVDLFSAYARVATSDQLYTANLQAAHQSPHETTRASRCRQRTWSSSRPSTSRSSGRVPACATHRWRQVLAGAAGLAAGFRRTRR